jgi:hypothetical protein
MRNHADLRKRAESTEHRRTHPAPSRIRRVSRDDGARGARHPRNPRSRRREVPPPLQEQTIALHLSLPRHRKPIAGERKATNEADAREKRREYDSDADRVCLYSGIEKRRTNEIHDVLHRQETAMTTGGEKRSHFRRFFRQ